MKPLVILFIVFLLAIASYLLLGKPIDYLYSGRIALSAMLLFTAIGHFAFKKGMVKMMPEFIPFKPQIVIITGVFEIVAGLILLTPFYTKVVGWVLIGFLLLILPANIYAAMHQVDYQNPDKSGPGLKYLWFRIPLQLFFIVWIYCTTIRV